MPYIKIHSEKDDQISLHFSSNKIVSAKMEQNEEEKKSVVQIQFIVLY